MVWVGINFALGTRLNRRTLHMCMPNWMNLLPQMLLWLSMWVQIRVHSLWPAHFLCYWLCLPWYFDWTKDILALFSEHVNVSWVLMSASEFPPGLSWFTGSVAVSDLRHSITNHARVRNKVAHIFFLQNTPFFIFKGLLICLKTIQCSPQPRLLTFMLLFPRFLHHLIPFRGLKRNLGHI